MAAFADEINDCPMLLALLQMRELQISQFAPPQSATKQHGENGAITLPFESACRGWLQEPKSFLGREPVSEADS